MSCLNQKNGQELEKAKKDQKTANLFDFLKIHYVDMFSLVDEKIESYYNQMNQINNQQNELLTVIESLKTSYSNTVKGLNEHLKNL